MQNIKLEEVSTGTKWWEKPINRNNVLLEKSVNEIMDLSLQLSNPNLLINGDFRNPVNQRTLSSYSGSNIYTIDRWITNFNPTITIQAGSIKINSGGDGSTYGGIRQILEDFKYLAGQSVTLSLKVKNVINSSWALELQGYSTTVTSESSKIYSFGSTSFSTAGLIVTTINLPEDLSMCDRFQFMVYTIEQNKEIEIEWAKLEIGSIATPFVPRPYGEELALCKRYFNVLNAGIALPLTFTFNLDGARVCDFLLPVGNGMRILPTITKDISTKCIVTNFATSVSKNNLELPTIIQSNSEISFYNLRIKEPGGTTIYDCFYPSGGNLYLNSEIY